MMMRLSILSRFSREQKFEVTTSPPKPSKLEATKYYTILRAPSHPLRQLGARVDKQGVARLWRRAHRLHHLPRLLLERLPLLGRARALNSSAIRLRSCWQHSAHAHTRGQPRERGRQYCSCECLACTLTSPLSVCDMRLPNSICLHLGEPAWPCSPHQKASSSCINTRARAEEVRQ